MSSFVRIEYKLKSRAQLIQFVRLFTLKVMISGYWSSYNIFSMQKLLVKHLNNFYEKLNLAGSNI